MRTPGLPVILVALLACDEGARPVANPDHVLGDELTLKVGETAHVTGIPLTFTAVLSDSRCPGDVVCVWSGNAEAEIAVGPPESTYGPTHRLILNSTVGPREGTALGLRLTLIELEPWPVSTRQIPPEDYVITLRVDGE
jgi:hypothetical protein